MSAIWCPNCGALSETIEEETTIEGIKSLRDRIYEDLVGLGIISTDIPNIECSPFTLWMMAAERLGVKEAYRAWKHYPKPKEVLLKQCRLGS